MKCLKKYFVCCYLIIVFVVSEVESIKNYPVDKNLISQEDRRGAEKDEKPLHIPESLPSETKKRGLSLGAVYRNPGQLIRPSVGLEYKPKRPDDEGYESHRTSSVLGTSRPHYSITDSRGGYIGNYPQTYYPGEHYGGGYPHSGGGGGIYEHSGAGGGFGGLGGGGGYEYPVYGPPSTGIGHHGGGGGGGYGMSFKNPGALKKLILPLAGLALLGAAAALTVNPVLLQLGVINGRRRRRGLLQVNNDVYPANHVVKPHEY